MILFFIIKCRLGQENAQTSIYAAPHTHTNHHEQRGGSLSIDVTVVGAFGLSAAVCDTKTYNVNSRVIMDQAEVSIIEGCSCLLSPH